MIVFVHSSLSSMIGSVCFKGARLVYNVHCTHSASNIIGCRLAILQQLQGLEIGSANPTQDGNVQTQKGLI